MVVCFCYMPCVLGFGRADIACEGIYLYPNIDYGVVVRKELGCFDDEYMGIDFGAGG